MSIFHFFDGYEKKSDEFRVTSGGTPLDVLSCTVSAHPLNRVWPGYQRPLEQTEPSSYVSLESDGEVTLEITPGKGFFICHGLSALQGGRAKNCRRQGNRHSARCGSVFRRI